MKKFLIYVLVICTVLTMVACDSTVDITLSSDLFTDETEEEIIAESEENGYENCVINEDGSVTYTMTKKQHNELVEATEVSLKEMIDGLANSETFASVKGAEANADYTEVTVFAEKESYEGSFDFFVLIGIQYSVDFYQSVKGISAEDKAYVIKVIDVETEEVLDSITYPEVESE